MAKPLLRAMLPLAEIAMMFMAECAVTATPPLAARDDLGVVGRRDRDAGCRNRAVADEGERGVVEVVDRDVRRYAIAILAAALGRVLAHSGVGAARRLGSDRRGERDGERLPGVF